MSSTPLISVCIPTFNGARYLGACLDSVLNQTMSNFEVLIVDDCSEDETLAIAREYAKRDERIRLESNERNLGLVGNWNHCINFARGDWIKYLFQDDMLLPECLSRFVENMDGSEPIICCKRDFIFEDGTDEALKKWYSKLDTIETLFPNKTHISAEAICEATLQSVGRNFIGEPTAVLLHRRVFDLFGQFNPNLVMMCDSEYWTRVAVHTGIAYIPETLAKFRVHATAASSLNRSIRQYRADILDRLVLFHDFSFNAEYQPLREYAKHRTPPVDLNHQLKTLTREARRIAEDAAHRADTPDKKLLEEWSDHLQRYPKLRKYLNLHATDITATFSKTYRPLRGFLNKHYARHIGWRFK